METSHLLLEAMSDRFEILLRRYFLMLKTKEIPQRFGQWLSNAPLHKRVFATLESVCTELFPDLVLPSHDQRWMLPVACVALKHHVSQLHGVEMSACGKALRALEQENQTGEKEDFASLSEPTESLHAKLLQALTRNAALEVRVKELESRTGEEEPQTKKRALCRHRPLPDDTLEQTLAYLSERRAEALDAYLALRKAAKRRPQELDRRLSSANAEIMRLRAENDALRRLKGAAVESTTPVILPKRALSLAGYWNLSPNDLLMVTPSLVMAVEQRGGTVIRREGMRVCFPSEDQRVVIAAALEVMESQLPHYQRREDV